jgi:hypothetical protein
MFEDSGLGMEVHSSWVADLKASPPADADPRGGKRRSIARVDGDSPAGTAARRDITITTIRRDDPIARERRGHDENTASGAAAVGKASWSVLPIGGNGAVELEKAGDAENTNSSSIAAAATSGGAPVQRQKCGAIRRPATVITRTSPAETAVTSAAAGVAVGQIAAAWSAFRSIDLPVVSA